jgi:hypothetical protein
MKSAKTRIRITFKKIQLISSFNTISKETKSLLTLSKTIVLFIIPQECNSHNYCSTNNRIKTKNKSRT